MISSTLLANFYATPSRAQDLVRAVYDAPSDLLTFPNCGRQGKKEGTRELVLSPLPYIVVDKVLGDVIFVVRILHGAQKWPSAGQQLSEVTAVAEHQVADDDQAPAIPQRLESQIDRAARAWGVHAHSKNQLRYEISRSSLQPIA